MKMPGRGKSSGALPIGNVPSMKASLYTRHLKNSWTPKTMWSGYEYARTMQVVWKWRYWQDYRIASMAGKMRIGLRFRNSRSTREGRLKRLESVLRKFKNRGKPQLVESFEVYIRIRR